MTGPPPSVSWPLADEPAAVYSWRVASEVDTPLRPGVYVVRLVEGGTYRNLASRRKYTVLELDLQAERIRYTYLRGEGERVERTGPLESLAVVEAVGDTPAAVKGPFPAEEVMLGD